MKKSSIVLAGLLFAACSNTQFTYNGLICPTDNMGTIAADMKSCKVYKLDEVDAGLKLDKECTKCIESKGYQILNVKDLNASQ